MNRSPDTPVTLVCALALLLAAFTGAVSGAVSAKLTTATAPDAPQSLGVQTDATRFTKLNITDGLSGSGGLTFSGPMDLGDPGLAGNGTRITVDDTLQTVSLGNTDAGIALVIDAVGQVMSASDLQLRTRRYAVNSTASDTLNGTHTNVIASNIGATGPITYTLPAAAAGLDLCFYVAAAQAIHVKPLTNDLIHAATASAGHKLVADAPGEYLCLMAADTTNWLPYAKAGTWTDTAP